MNEGLINPPVFWDNDGVAWTKPAYSRSEVNRAGERLRDCDDPRELDAHSLAVIHNWRASCAYPLDQFRRSFQRHAARNSAGAMVVHRLKRLDAIHAKLRRSPSIDLCRMQDVAGCRVIMPSMHLLTGVMVSRLEQRVQPELFKADNYVREPKASGYRGVHWIYKYHSNTRPEYEGIRIEIQLRTHLQHVWATALESVELHTAQPLKAGEGNPEWLRLFALMGSYLAYQERLPMIPGTPESIASTCDELRELVNEYRLWDKFAAMRIAVDHSFARDDAESGSHFLLVWDRIIVIHTYPRNKLQDAIRDLREAEEGACVAVLVSAESLDHMKRAYNNYFMDIAAFTNALGDAISGIT